MICRTSSSARSIAFATRSVAKASTPSIPFFFIGSSPKAARCAAAATSPKTAPPTSPCPRLSAPTAAIESPVSTAAKSFRGIAGGRATARAAYSCSARSPSFASQADSISPANPPSSTAVSTGEPRPAAPSPANSSGTGARNSIRARKSTCRARRPRNGCGAGGAGFSPRAAGFSPRGVGE